MKPQSQVLAEHGERKWSLGELCEAADCKERWVREWVGVLAGAGIIKLEENMIISVSPDVAAALHPDKVANVFKFICSKKHGIYISFLIIKSLCRKHEPNAQMQELINFFTSLEFTFDKEPKIGACFKKSGPLGVPYSEFPNFQVCLHTC